jgi:hypothetical protein
MARRGEIPARILPTGDIVFEADALRGWLAGLGREVGHAE